MDLQALNNELTDNPLGMPYADHIAAGRHSALAKILNAEIVAWEQGGTFERFDLRTFDGTLYMCQQGHTNHDPDHTPPITPALWLSIGSGSIPAIVRTSIPASEVRNSIDWQGEYAALNTDDKEIVRQLTSYDLNATHTSTMDTLEAIFGAASDTWATIDALTERTGSRAEDLFGQSVSIEHVRQALNL